MAKTFCVLLPVLGLTWLIGIVTFNKDIIEMQYIFAILNSLQGFFIFLFYVVYSQEVRREISHRIAIWKTAKEINGQAQVTRDSKLRYSEQTNSLPSYKTWM
ncbi:adhesion G- coupled receptor D1-like [Paramuricea clavata]|uniref:Adhesion G- coupled receptor D1-like n=1 Tax=Paramuricea clavata TaxID=317549 RepID=A0A6S7H5P6_PARCT|nr:adhesion G- coupled receptor D1-like [Paramuricea clavata]